MKNVLLAAALMAAISGSAMAEPFGRVHPGYGGGEMRRGSCTGILESSGQIHDKVIGTCSMGGSPGYDKVSRACTVGDSCTVTGMVNDCEGADYCVEFIKIASAKKNVMSATLGGCDKYDTSPERAACRVHVLRNCPKTPLSAWKQCWDSHR